MNLFDKKRLPLYFAVILIGLSSITAQVLFLRELIAIFYGNELIFGIILTVWLLTYSLGSGLLGRFADHLKNLEKTLVATQVFIIILLPTLLFLIRIIKNLLGIQLGILLGFPTIASITLLILFPLTLILGFQFALASKLLGKIGWAYMLEAVGSVIGGLLLSLILLLLLNPFQITALLSILLAVSGMILLKNYKFPVPAIIAIALLILSPYLDDISNRLCWKGFRLVKSTDSPYGKLAVIKDAGEYSFFMDGNLLFSTADRAGAEEFVHLSFLQHENPKEILLVGGGLGGALDEILKYPVTRIDYVELDPKVIQLAKKYISKDFPLRAAIHPVDGIRFINQTGEKYDLILINLPEPGSALINRFYTLEFYAKCKNHLKEKGILAFKLPVSADYMGAEMRNLNASALKTASAVFAHVSLIPGNYNYFFASENQSNLSPTFLLNRWKQRKIKTEYFKTPALAYLLTPRRIEYVRESISFDEKTRINTDLQPISYYQSLLLWTSYFDSPLKSFFRKLMEIKLEYMLGALLVLMIGIIILGRRYRAIAIPSLIALLGFAGMSAQVTIILTFQSQYGYVYQAIGLLTAAFMGGLAAGSFSINYNDERIKSPKGLIILILFLFLLYFSGFFFALSKALIPLPLFLISSFVIGSFVGAVFPLAVRIEQQFNQKIGRLAGVLYGADLLGSSLAAILVSIFFIPIYGILGTEFIIAGLILSCISLSL